MYHHYLDRRGNSGVSGYSIEEDHILVYFKDRSLYTFSYDRPGMRHVEELKRRAFYGIGLNSYINKHVKSWYADKTCY